MARWRIDYLAGKNKHLGTVELPDEKGAIAEATKLFRRHDGSSVCTR